MMLYHGSTVKVIHPLLNKCRNNTDFGKSFYTTSNKLQAEQWTQIIINRRKIKNAIISVFEFDTIILKTKELSILEFNGVSEQWLDFVFANRNNNKTNFYDIVFGPVANDSLYTTLRVFEQGIITKEQAIQRLKTHTLVDQISFHSEKAIQTLQYTKSYSL